MSPTPLLPHNPHHHLLVIIFSAPSPSPATPTSACILVTRCTSAPPPTTSSTSPTTLPLQVRTCYSRGPLCCLQLGRHPQGPPRVLLQLKIASHGVTVMEVEVRR